MDDVQPCSIALCFSERHARVINSHFVNTNVTLGNIKPLIKPLCCSLCQRSPGERLPGPAFLGLRDEEGRVAFATVNSSHMMTGRGFNPLARSRSQLEPIKHSLNI